MRTLSRLTGGIAFVVACASILFLTANILGLIWNINILDDIPLELSATAGVAFIASSSVLIVQRLFLAVAGRGRKGGSTRIVKGASKFDPDVESYEI